MGAQPVRYIRVFDRAETARKKVRVSGYGDLDKHPEIIAFEGHIAPGGQAYLKLRRKDWRRVDEAS